MGNTITVEYKDDLLEIDGCLGEARYKENKIILQSNTSRMSKTVIEQTFFHELVHSIFSEMGRSDLNKDEPFVDTLAGLLHQAIKTMK